MHINQATLKDIPSIVSIHCDAFKDFFLTSLGNKFLSFYYSCFIKSPDGLVLCAIENGDIIGFSATAKYSNGFNRKLIMQNKYSFIKITCCLLITNPKALLRLAHNLSKKNSDVKDDENYAELFSIAVKNDNQGKGIGKHLLISTENVLKHENVEKLSLTTDYYNNNPTIAFYKSMNFNILYEFMTYPRRKMYRLVKNLSII
jgi:ribosomal protein S18 acetylase RimI-like enzyme